MRDLRRQALESKKTVSRKALSKEQDRSLPRSNLRTRSRTSGQNRSDENNIQFSDGGQNLNPTDDVISIDSLATNSDKWTLDIVDRIEEIKDRKRSSAKGREKALLQYTRILMNHFAHDEIKDRTSDILPAILKSLKAQSSEQEVFQALLAIALTTITAPSDTIYANTEQELRRLYRISNFNQVKTTTIHTLSTVAIYGGASDFEINEIMDEFIDIVESDGSSIDAPDSGAVVAAACEAWGYLATYLDELEEKVSDGIEAFVEQLYSSDTSVQIAAGENIALLFESSYTDSRAEDDQVHESEDEGSYVNHSNSVARFEVYKKKDQLMHTLTELANKSSKHIAKKDRKNLHLCFSDIINTIEHPTYGPRYQNALDMETGKSYGSRMTFSIPKMGSLKIDRWWKSYRLRALKRMLGGGIFVHIRENEAVLDSIAPVIN
ncbi:Uncharacterized protein C20F10.03 [Golovinomyces cichoracearum]|uniref:Uncharacterized protein C20F10.03 n=1 Tax=Golovinomyces cichoracearum TaxID=62708 RepID=A0A420IAA6_9PEZI|nr:Uncharacterized protein C20F10.03 [Golovinomyces cichoracearum]